MNSLTEYLIYYTVKSVGFLICLLPSNVALLIGRMVGRFGYYISIKHKSLACANLKIAFAKTKTPNEINSITKQLFVNYGQNFIELFRLPLMNEKRFTKLIKVEGKEHVDEAIRQGKGCILLPMHFGSWELASLSCAMLGHPYKMFVKPQTKFPKLDELLNSYRTCGGTVLLSRGLGTRELIKSLRNNEVVSMVVDQGGRDGVLVPFFNRQASMSVGAIRLALKFGVPVCFAIIVRGKGANHRLIIHEPMKLENSGDTEEDIVSNLNNIVKVMEHYIEKYPAEYMWFYKIWKYSKESTILILSDGKTGHLRQSQAVGQIIERALSERGIAGTTQIADVKYKNGFCARLMSLIGLFSTSRFYLGRLGFLEWFLTRESFKSIVSLKADFIVSCGSSIASVNYLLCRDHRAKNIAILRPGLLGFRKFTLVILPRHDRPSLGRNYQGRVVWTRVAPNLITKDYMEEQTELLLKRYSHLRNRLKMKIGLLVGGDTKNYTLSESQVRFVVNQIKEAAEETNADVLVTTSRRTPKGIENLLWRELRRYPRCPLIIIANRTEVPEAVGGILGASDIVIVSGDSISMISEAISSGKSTIVFPLQSMDKFRKRFNKYNSFIGQLNDQGYVLSADAKEIGRFIFDIARNKMQTKPVDDRDLILKEIKEII